MSTIHLGIWAGVGSVAIFFKSVAILFLPTVSAPDSELLMISADLALDMTPTRAKQPRLAEGFREMKYMLLHVHQGNRQTNMIALRFCPVHGTIDLKQI